MSSLFGSRRHIARVIRYTCLFVLALTLVGVAQAAPIFFPVLPDSTYLASDAQDGALAPIFINLTELPGYAPGAMLNLQTIGDLCFDTGAECTQYAVPLGAVFSSTGLTLTAVALGIAPVITPTTFYDGTVTDIAQDFLVPLGSPLSVAIPGGASYLAVGVIDRFYADNSDPEPGDLGINVEVVIPEPGTFMLLVPGLGLLWALRRRKK